MPGDPTVEFGSSPDEVAWFVGHHRRALEAARRLAHAHAVLDGGLDVAHARGDAAHAARVLKYQVEADLLVDLGAFRQECLAGLKVERTPRLAALWAMLTVVVGDLSERLPQLIDVGRARPEDLQDVRQRFRDTSAALDAIIDDCVDALTAGAPDADG